MSEFMIANFLYGFGFAAALYYAGYMVPLISTFAHWK